MGGIMVGKRKKSFWSLLFHLYLFLWCNQLCLDANLPESQWVTPGQIKARRASLSSDGRIMAYVQDKGEMNELWIKYVKDKGNGIRVHSNRGEIDGPIFSTSNETLYFSMKRDGFSKIYKKRLRSTADPEALTFGKSNDFHPALSPDGKFLAFDTDRTGNFDIFLLNLATGNLDQLTQYQKHDFDPAFSPDGKYLAYTSFRNKTFNLFLKNLRIAGSQALQLTQEEFVTAHPAFDSRGKGIFFDSNRSGSNQIYYFDLSSHQILQVTQKPQVASFPHESGGILLFDSEEYGVFGIRKMPLKDETYKQFQAQESPAQEPVKDLKELARAVQELRVEKGADFEADLKRIEEEKSTIVKELNMQNPASFETPTFDLSFLEKKKLEKTGILTDGEGLGIQNQEAVDARNQNQSELHSLQDGQLSASFQGREIVAEPAPEQAPNWQEQKAQMAKAEVSMSPLDQLFQNAPRGLPIMERSQRVSEETVVDRNETSVVAKSGIESYFEPKMPEMVETTLPRKGSVNVPLYQPISLVLNRNIYKGEESILQGKLLKDGVEVPVQVDYNKNQNRIDIVPNEKLEPGTEYRVYLGRATWSFQTEGEKLSKNPRVVATEKSDQFAKKVFKIERVFPKARSRANKVGAPVQVQFSDKIDPETINASSLTLYANGQIVPGEMTFESNDKVLTLRPYRNLGEATVYEVKVSKDLRSVAGVSFEGPNSWKFKTQYYSPFLITDYPPTILDSEKMPIEIAFNRPVGAKSIQSDQFFIQGKNFKYRGRVELKNANRTLVFTTYQKVPDQQDFRFFLSPNLTDEDGNFLENVKPIQLSSRFPQDSMSQSQKLMARARSYRSEPAHPRTDSFGLATIETFFQKGYIQNRLAQHIGSGQQVSRYKVALLIEEALTNATRMNRDEKGKLEELVSGYQVELKNLGVDVGRVKARLTGQVRNRRSSPQSSDFASRGRRL